MKLFERTTIVLCGLLVLALAASAGAATLRLDPATSRIHFQLGATGHDVEGSFALTSGEIHFDPAQGTASGTLVVDATSAETGSKKRDKTMHTKVLESEQYPTFSFRAESMEGSVPASGSSQITLHGVLTVHGDEHPVSLATTIEVGAGRLQAHTEFDIPFVEWGMEDPSMFLLKVEKVVHVTVDAEGTLSDATAATSQ